jgi:hypothetical protein
MHHIEKPTDITIPKTSLWAKLPIIGGVLAVVGLGATFAMIGSHKAEVMHSYLWAYEFALSIALGGLAFTLIQHAVRAGWSTVIRRIPETAMMTLPLFALLFVPIAAFGMHELYPWTHETDAILERKRWYLTEGGFFVRAGFYFLVWSGLAWALYSRSTKLDTMTDHDERSKTVRQLWGISAGGLFLFGLTMTFQSVDWLKTLTPHWYSTMWGVYYFAGAMFAFYAFTTLVLMGLQKAGLIKTAVTTEHFHDLGKFMFGHTVFWAYIAFSQFMLQWYANIPEETEFWIHRVHGGWEYISYGLPFVHFFIPFLYLVSRHVKRHRLALVAAAFYFLIVHAVDLYWVVLPSANHGHEPHLAPSFINFTALLGVCGAFMAVFGFFLNRNKVICIGDPRLEESMAHENY